MTRSRADLLAACLVLLIISPARADLPTGARFRMGTTQFRHGAPIGFLGFAPDGRTVVSGSGDGTVRLWDVATGRDTRRFSGSVYGSSVAFSTDGKALAVVGLDQFIHLWDVATGKELHRLAVPPNGVAMAAFARDGKTLAVVGGDQAIWLGEPTAGKKLRQLTRPVQPQGPGSPPPFSAGVLALSPDGKLLAVAGSNGMGVIVRLWDVATGKELPPLAGPRGSVTQLVFSAHARVLAIGCGSEHLVRLVEVPTGKEIRLFAGLRATGASVTFSPDCKTLTIGGGNRVQLVETATGRVTRELPAPASGYYAVAFSPDGRTLAVGGTDHLIRFWDVGTGREIRPTEGHHGPISAVVLSPDGKLLATSGGDGTVRLWVVATGKEVRQWTRPQPPPDGAGAVTVVFGSEGKTLVAAWSDSAVAVWDVATGKQTRFLPGTAGAYSPVVLSPDGRNLVAVGADGNPRLRDVMTGRVLRRFRLQAQPVPPVPGQPVPPAVAVTALALSPDGRMLATGQAGVGGSPYANLGYIAMPQTPGVTAVRLWEVATGQERGQVVVNRAAVPLYGSSYGTTVFLGDLGTSQFMAAGVSLIHFAPDGRTLVAATDAVLHLFDLADNREIRRLEGLSAVPSAVAFSPDGKLVAAGGIGAFALWETATGKLLAVVAGHQGTIASVAFSADGKVLATGGADTAALVWDVRAVIAEGRRRATEPSLAELNALWNALGGDAARAYPAQWTLVRAPARAVPFLRERLRPAPPVDAGRIDRLVTELDHEKFAVRQRAAEELEKLGDVALPALYQVLEGKPSLELRKRVEELLHKLEGPVTDPERLRALRAVEVLERVGTPEARQVLETLAQGDPAARLTREANGSLTRLARR